MLTIQYLEETPELSRLSSNAVVDKLRFAAAHVPLTHLLIGWHLPPRLLEACRGEAERLGIRFLRWHPLLTSDSGLQPSPDRQVVGVSGRPIGGFGDLPEFTFVCPNNPQVHECISRRLETLVRTGLYEGFFLDRIRFPSPAANPLNELGCFCKYCGRKAAEMGLDLEEVRRALELLAGQPEGALSLGLTLLGAPSVPGDHHPCALIESFLDFRSQSVAALVGVLAAQLRTAGVEIGLDCFSPSLTRMVGQDLGALGAHVDWIKIMCYAHTLAPAGIPYELLGLCRFVQSAAGLEQADALGKIASAVGYPLPTSARVLQESGISSIALRQEIETGIKATTTPVLPGIEVVEMAGIVCTNDSQLTADLQAVKLAQASGISLSWDLLHIPQERLDLVRAVYLQD